VEVVTAGVLAATVGVVVAAVDAGGVADPLVVADVDPLWQPVAATATSNSPGTAHDRGPNWRARTDIFLPITLRLSAVDLELTC
jgi:hypothetical protein